MTEPRLDSVLVVDSEVVVRAEIAAYLRDCGFLVIEAASTDEAVTILSDGRFSVDAVLCEAEANGSLTGFGLARWLRQTTPETRIVLAGSIEKTASAAANLCEDGPHVSSPYEHAQVSDFIRRQLASRRQSQPSGDRDA